MGLPSGARAIMAEKSGQQSRSIRTGDTIGEFKVLALDTENVKFEWDGKEVARKIADLVDRSNPQAGAQQNQGPAAPPPSPAAPPPPQPSGPVTSKDIGIELTPGSHACKPGENSPAGTVIDGFRKTITYSPFGATCRWVK
jgi:hypothetical protein